MRQLVLPPLVGCCYGNISLILKYFHAILPVFTYQFCRPLSSDFPLWYSLVLPQWTLILWNTNSHGFPDRTYMGFFFISLSFTTLCYEIKWFSVGPIIWITFVVCWQCLFGLHQVPQCPSHDSEFTEVGARHVSHTNGVFAGFHGKKLSIGVIKVSVILRIMQISYRRTT